MVDVIEPFATADDLEERWPDMPAGSSGYADTLLLDASQFIVDTVSTAMSASANTRKRVVCAVVKRAMQNPIELSGMESVQQGAGPYQQTSRPVNPHGDFYLTGQEKRALGWGRQESFVVDMWSGGVVP